MPTALNLAHIRAEFPALNDEVAYLDNAGGSQVLRRVADRVRDYLLTSAVQLGASYAQSQDAGAKVFAARRSVAELINAPFDDEVVMGGSTTSLMFQLTSAILPTVQPGDEIIVSNTDHEANIGGWMRLASAGAVLKISARRPSARAAERGRCGPRRRSTRVPGFSPGSSRRLACQRFPRADCPRVRPRLPRMRR